MKVEATDQRNYFDVKNKVPVQILLVGTLLVLFALFSFITGNRLKTLQTDLRNTINATSVTDADMLKEIKATLVATTESLVTTEKGLDEEKKKNDRLKKKISVVTKKVESVKAELAGMKQMIADEKASELVEPSPTDQSSSLNTETDHPTTPEDAEAQQTPVESTETKTQAPMETVQPEKPAE